MSRTNKTKNTTNPAKRFIEWSSVEKCWKTYDKDTKENKLLPANIPFILLDQLSTVTGFNQKAKKSMYGTEVKDLSQPIKVFLDGETIAEAPWKDLKESVPAIKFGKSVYAMAKIDGEFELVCFKLSGCSVGSWFDFVGEVGLSTLEGDSVVSVTGTEEDVNGATTFNRPVFQIIKNELSDEAAKQADAADEALQEYLKEYLKGSAEEPSDDTPGEDAEREREMEEGSAPPLFEADDEGDDGTDVPF